LNGEQEEYKTISNSSSCCAMNPAAELFLRIGTFNLSLNTTVPTSEWITLIFLFFILKYSEKTSLKDLGS